jgi:hypothetical protein
MNMPSLGLMENIGEYTLFPLEKAILLWIKQNPDHATAIICLAISWLVSNCTDALSPADFRELEERAAVAIRGQRCLREMMALKEGA